MVGLEPGTNLPNTKTKEKEQGRVIVLSPRESRTFELTLEYMDDASRVDSAAKTLMQPSRQGK